MGSETASDTAPSAKQVVFLFMAATVVAVVVFLCGVLVGRGVPLGEGLTVSGSAVESLGVDDLPPPTLSTPSDEPSAAAGESGDLSYFRRLSEGEPELETLRPEAEDAAAALPAPPVDAPGVDGGDADLNRSAPQTDLDALPTVDTTPASTPVASTSTSSVGGFWVQVAALRSQESAQQIANQLVAKGYPATVVLPETGNPVRLFRVRVGPYDRTEAQRTKGRLETEEQFVPFVTR